MTDGTDLLWGLKEIARHLRKTPRQVQHMHDKRLLPTFKMGSVVCATKSGIAAHFAKLSGGDVSIGLNTGDGEGD